MGFQVILYTIKSCDTKMSNSLDEVQTEYIYTGVSKHYIGPVGHKAGSWL